MYPNSLNVAVNTLRQYFARKMEEAFGSPERKRLKAFRLARKTSETQDHPSSISDNLIDIFLPLKRATRLQMIRALSLLYWRDSDAKSSSNRAASLNEDETQVPAIDNEKAMTPVSMDDLTPFVNAQDQERVIHEFFLQSISQAKRFDQRTATSTAAPQSQAGRPSGTGQSAEQIESLTEDALRKSTIESSPAGSTNEEQGARAEDALIEDDEPDFDVDFANILLHESSANLLIKIAENMSTPPRVLEQLALSTDPDVRIALADNASTPYDVVRMLTKDENADVRYALAENHNLPRHILQLLIADENPFVSHRAQKTLNRLEGGSVVRREFKMETVPVREACSG
ncbi:MAG TPA: hypothetical protein V6D17_22250 [Candidatus Obscuribacterales bacterium]